MTSYGGETEALLHSARVFTADGFARFGYVEAREASIAVFENATITARNYVVPPMQFMGAVYDGDNRLVRSSLGFSEGQFTPLDPDAILPERRAGAHPVKRALYGGTLYFVLGHFLFETVARLWHGVDFRARSGRRAMPVVFHPWPGLDLDRMFDNPLYRAVLEALGIERRAIVLANIDLAVDVLHYPSPLSVYHEYLHPMMERVFDHLATELAARSRRLPKLGRPGGRQGRVFLSRSRWSSNRRIENEAELEELFRQQGFEIVHPQSLAPGRLVERLQDAEILASADGSQAHLAAFCRPGTRALLVDTRPVPTQFAIERMRRFRALHIPVCTNGQWNGTDRIVDVSPRMERLVAAALETDLA